MSDLLDPEFRDVDSGGSQRHAMWALIVLGCIALIFASLMVFLTGGGHKQNKGLLNVPVQTSPGTTSAATSATPSPTGTTTNATKTSPAARATTPTVHARAGNPCAGNKSCIVDGDGGAIAAVNALRQRHGLPPVPGAVTKNAQTCALNNGGGSTCVPHYAWTNVPTQNGPKAVAKITGFAGSWLLDPKMSSLGVGWAYVGGSYQCVLLKAP